MAIITNTAIIIIINEIVYWITRDKVKKVEKKAKKYIEKLKKMPTQNPPPTPPGSGNG